MSHDPSRRPINWRCTVRRARGCRRNSPSLSMARRLWSPITRRSGTVWLRNMRQTGYRRHLSATCPRSYGSPSRCGCMATRIRHSTTWWREREWSAIREDIGTGARVRPKIHRLNGTRWSRFDRDMLHFANVMRPAYGKPAFALQRNAKKHLVE